MIRINLLQVGRKKKAKPLPAFIILLILLTVATILGVGVGYMNLSGKVNNLRLQKTRNDARIKELKEKVKEVDDFEAKIKLFQEKKKVIVGLREKQSVPVKFLNELSYTLADGVWLKDLSVKDNNVKIDGYAFTNTNVVEFVNNLKRSALFSEVYLEESKEATIEKFGLYEFKLRFMINQVTDGKKS